MRIKTTVENLASYKIYVKLEDSVHTFLKEKGYLRVDVPVLSPALIPESYLEVFKTEYRYLGSKENLFLTPSPELFLKRVLSEGIGDCYSLVKSFRNNERPSSLHSFEFMMLEFYKTKADYMDLAEDLLELLLYISRNLTQKDYITYQGKTVRFDRWEKLRIAEAFEKYASVPEAILSNQEMLKKHASKKGYKTEGFSYEDIFSQIYASEIEPHLGQDGYPTLLYDYPKEFAALAKLNADGKTAQRFEFYICGVELGDCYTELTDWKEQEKRFEEERRRRLGSDKIDHPVDKGLVEALKYGLKSCAGIAIGFDRLAMIFANATSIEELKLITISED